MSARLRIAGVTAVALLAGVASTGTHALAATTSSGQAAQSHTAEHHDGGHRSDRHHEDDRDGWDGDGWDDNRCDDGCGWHHRHHGGLLGDLLCVLFF
jgi:hypothetical protein